MKNTKIHGVWLVHPLNDGRKYFKVGMAISNGGDVSGVVQSIEETPYGIIIAHLLSSSGQARTLRFNANVAASEEASNE